jgi:hypothetical protein
MKAEEAHRLLYECLQRMFGRNIPLMQATRFDASVEVEARAMLVERGSGIEESIDGLALNVRRYLYELLTQMVVMLTLVTPEKRLPAFIEDGMDDREKLTGLLRSGICEMPLEFPRPELH